MFVAAYMSVDVALMPRGGKVKYHTEEEKLAARRRNKQKYQERRRAGLPLRPKIKDLTDEERKAYQRKRIRDYESRRRAIDPEGYKAKKAAAVRRYAIRYPDRCVKASTKWRKANQDHVNEVRRKWRDNNIVKALFLEARFRAKSRGMSFELSFEDLPPMGTHCPLLGHAFPPPQVRNTPYSPSIDRIDSRKGYVRGNVWIVGWRANLIKNDGTAEEHEMIAKAMREAQKNVIPTEREMTVAAMRERG
jgi:hypothetical protein